MAGLVDGEGSFYYVANRKSWHFGIQMTDLKTIEFFKDRLGIDAQIIERPSKNGCKVSYQIGLAKNQTIDLIKIVGPYLVTKRDLAYQIWQESLG